MNNFDSQRVERAKNAVIGAFVADAASMGLHWLYSQRRILEVAPSQPEFLQPLAQNFDGNVGYFAHGGKHAGELSQYGEQMFVMLDALSINNGEYAKHLYQDSFRDHFGYGGMFKGYIDRPTRETLDSIYRSEHEALRRADTIPFEGDTKQKPSILIKMLAAAKRYSGQRLVEEAAYISAPFADAEACHSYALALIAALDGSADYPGARDEQLPAISKLPPLVGRYAGDKNLEKIATSAVKVTNNTPRALDFAMISTAVLASIIKDGDIDSSIKAGLEAAGPDSQHLLNTALQRTSTLSELTKEFGMHCDLGSGMASVLYNLRGSTGYVDAVRANIYAGGDNCGRSIMLGAVLGSAYGIGGDRGIPDAWIAKIDNHQELLEKVDTVFKSLTP